jgi:hypothetical protein
MKNKRKKSTERQNFSRSRRQERIYPFLERILEDRLLDVYQAFQESQKRMFWAVLDKISELESLQMDLVKIQSGLTQKLFPDYVPVPREQASRGYHETYMN